MASEQVLQNGFLGDCRINTQFEGPFFCFWGVCQIPDSDNAFLKLKENFICVASREITKILIQHSFPSTKNGDFGKLWSRNLASSPLTPLINTTSCFGLQTFFILRAPNHFQEFCCNPTYVVSCRELPLYVHRHVHCANLGACPSVGGGGRRAADLRPRPQSARAVANCFTYRKF